MAVLGFIAWDIFKLEERFTTYSDFQIKINSELLTSQEEAIKGNTVALDCLLILSNCIEKDLIKECQFLDLQLDILKVDLLNLYANYMHMLPDGTWVRPASNFQQDLDAAKLELSIKDRAKKWGIDVKLNRPEGK